MSQVKRIDLDEFDEKIKPGFVEVSTSALGGKVIACSDDFFASRDNLIKPTPSASMKGQFGPNGALYDGWESRRHNPNYDWVIIRLAPALSSLHYVDIDTSHFNGNESPYSSVFALRLDPSELASGTDVKLSPKDPRWEEIMPVTELGPDSRHIFQLDQKASSGTWSALMVRMIPDGGMARFRAYGLPIPPTPLTSLPDPSVEPINLLDPLLGARIVTCSDKQFSPPGNLLLPGRGTDMSDGWETRRSQVGRGKYGKGGPLEGKERKEWVIARLAGTGVVKYVDVDTAFHPGNYPVACAVEATLSEENMPPESAVWTTIVAKKPLGPHRQHFFDVERNVPIDQIFSHVRLSTYPDGGLKRLRIYGHPIAPSPSPKTATLPGDLTIPALPLTVEAFKPYGDVIQGYSFKSSAPKGTDVTVANQGTAFKFHRLAKVEETYPAGMLKRGGLGIGLIRGMPHYDTRHGLRIPVKMLERHACTTQAFIPMGKGVSPGTEPLPAGGAYIVVAALNGKDDKPDLDTVRAFLVTPAQGVSYHPGIWHHFMLTVDAPMDYACVEAQVGDPGLLLDCEYIAPISPYCHVQVPPHSFEPAAAPPSALAPEHSHAHAHEYEPHAGHIHPHGHTHSAFETISHLLPSLPSSVEATVETLAHPTHAHSHAPVVPLPITPESFAPFGNIIRAYTDEDARPATMIVQGSLKTGKSEKYNRLAHILESYPYDSGAVTSISVFRATKKVGLERGRVFDIRLMERHPYTTQAFIPMGKAEWSGKGEDALAPGGTFLVVVAKNGHDDRPDPQTLKAFIMESATGLSYAAGTWHHPVLVLDSTLDLACVETQVATGVLDSDPRDCELLQWEGAEVFGRVAVPE